MVQARQENPDLIGDDELLEPTPEEKLETFFEGIGAGDGTRISIHEVDEENRNRRRFLFYVAADQITSDELLTQVLDRFGAGEYEASAKTEAGQYKFRQRFFLGSSKKKPYQIPGPTKETATPAAATAAGTDPALLALLERHDKTLAMLAERLTEREKPISIVEIASQFGQLKELFTPSAPVQTALDMVKEFNALREEFSGDNDDPLAMAIKQLLPTITEAVNKMEKSPSGRRMKPNAGVGTPTGETMNAIPKGPPEEQILTMYLGPILQWIANGATSDQAAQQIGGTINQLDDDQFIAVLTYLEAPDVIENLAKLDPRVTEHAEWFTATIAGVLKLFPAEPDPAEVDANAGTTVDSTASEKKTD